MAIEDGTAGRRRPRWEIGRSFLASATTGGIIMASTNWLDCLKIRHQVHSDGGGVLDLGRRIVATEGLWRGLWGVALPLNIAACTVSVGVRIGLYPAVRDSWSTAC